MNPQPSPVKRVPCPVCMLPRLAMRVPFARVPWTLDFCLWCGAR